MSLFFVQKAIFTLKKDAEFADRFRKDAGAALATYDLTAEEKAALVNADLQALYRMGVHPLLLAPFSRLAGIPRPKYQALLAPLKGLHRMESRPKAAAGSQEVQIARGSHG